MQGPLSNTKTAPRSFLSPTVDYWGVGLLSLVTFVSLHLASNADRITPAQLASAAWAAYYLGFLINWPHFAASYQLLYSQSRSAWRRPAFLWAALVCPLLLFALFAGIIHLQKAEAMGWMIHAMYFFVGWHYVKQTFGISLLLCHQRGHRLNAASKTALKVFLVTLWWMNWVLLNAGTGYFNFYEFHYPQIDFPEELKLATIGACALAGLTLVGLVTGQRLRGGTLPPAPAIATVLTMVIWYLPALYHPVYFLFIPFFHSLQYLVCVAAYRRGKIGTGHRTALNHLAFAFGMGVLGYLMFEGVPGTLDRLWPQSSWGSGQTFGAAFVLFVNIHHYFIDNVIWRRDFGDLQLHLQGAGGS